MRCMKAFSSTSSPGSSTTCREKDGALAGQLFLLCLPMVRAQPAMSSWHRSAPRLADAFLWYAQGQLVRRDRDQLLAEFRIGSVPSRSANRPGGCCVPEAVVVFDRRQVRLYRIGQVVGVVDRQFAALDVEHQVDDVVRHA